MAKWRQHAALVIAFSAAILYGSTYQQFRFFSLDAPGGAADAVEYVKIARGDPGVDLTGPHFHRWITPAAVRVILPLADRLAGDPEQAVTLAFFLVNFTFSIAASLLLCAFLQQIGFSILLSLIGMGAFASSRITVLATATPIVDAAFYCAVAAVLYLTAARKALGLALLLPVLALSKETILPFMLLPALTGLRRSRAYWAALVIAVITMRVSDLTVDAIYMTQGPSLADSIAEHLQQVGFSLQDLTTLGGLHDFQSGFSLLLPLAGIGVWLNARHRYHQIPGVVLATVPIALALAVLSGNVGRMFFAAFPAVIAYALITVEHVAGRSGAAPEAPTI